MAWTALTRGGYDVYRDLVNTPAFLAMLPPIEGLLCLDLGCGEGHNTRMLANQGARAVAVDISDSLIEAAVATGQPGICYALGNGEDLPFGDATFDVVTGFMSFMDASDPERVLGEATRVLRQDGVLQFSITHPSTSPPGRRWVTNEAGEREALAIGALAGASFVMPLKMWVAEGAANRVAEQLIPTEVHSGCTASPSDVNAVGLLMSAHEVCVYRQPNPTVWFRHTSGPYQGIGVDKGLIYAPSGLGDNNDTIICVRHLAGFWWAYYLDPDRQGGCPVFYHGGAIATPTRSEFFNDSLMEGRG